jgi:acyl carrier protein
MRGAMVWWTTINLNPPHLIPFIACAISKVNVKLREFSQLFEDLYARAVGGNLQTVLENDETQSDWEMLVKTANDQQDPQPSATRDRDAVLFIVRKYIIDNLLLGGSDDLNDHTLLMEAGFLDSTSAMELVAFLQETFAISIDDDEIVPENLNSIEYIANFVCKKLSY